MNLLEEIDEYEILFFFFLFFLLLSFFIHLSLSCLSFVFSFRYAFSIASDLLALAPVASGIPASAKDAEGRFVPYGSLLGSVRKGFLLEECFFARFAR